MKKRFLSHCIRVLCFLPAVLFLTRATGFALPTSEAVFVSTMQEEAAGGSAEARRQALIHYTVSLGTGTGRRIAEPDAREKTMLVMHQLRRIAGNERFARATAALSSGTQRDVDWGTVRAVLEKETGRDLGWFFTQWIDRAGLPDLDAENVRYRASGAQYEIQFNLVQKGAVYLLEVPVAIRLQKGGILRRSVALDSAKKQVSLLVDDEPLSATLDPDYEVPRKLTPDEVPSLCGALLHDDTAVLVLPAHDPGRYRKIVGEANNRFRVRPASGIRDADLRESSLLILGSDNPVSLRLFGRVEADPDTLLLARRNPWNPEKVVVIVAARSTQEADAASRLLDAPGDASVIRIDPTGAVVRTVGESERGIIMELGSEPQVIETAALKTLDRAVEAASGDRIVYLGEIHDQFSHHAVQLRVIKALFEKNRKLAIGMEMFQRPFQHVVDEYIAGSIDEREFLKRTEYFKRWIFDYNLYKPILDFARQERIPVVALNLRKEITEKVSRSGLDSLTDEERNEIPAETDFSDSDYRERLQHAFSDHKNNGERNFDYFYEAQVLWDETMATSIDEYLRKNPDRQLVVAAGSGHLAYRSGIPKRAFRRNGLSYTTIVNDMDVDRDAADFLVYPQPLDGVTAPRLMVVLKENGGHVSVGELAENSISGKAGIRPDDEILAIDGHPVHSVEEVKLELFFTTGRESFKVRVLRKRFLLKDREIEFELRPS